MTPDQKHKEYYNADTLRGIEIGKKHRTPSGDTQKFIDEQKEYNKLISQLNTNNMEMKKDIDFIKDKIKEMPTRDEMLRCNKELLIEVMKEADDRYASKQTEENLRWAIRIVIAIIIASVLGLVLIK